MPRLARQGVGADPELLAGLYAGDLLADVAVRDPSFQGWLAVERPRLHQTAGDTLEAILKDALDREDADRTERAAKALLALEPAHEEAHRALIRHHGLRGDVLGAIRQYEACRDALTRELDLAPAAETEALLAKVRAGGLRREIVVRPPVLSSITVMTTRAAPHASVAVDEKAPATGDAADAAVVVALAAAVRETLSRKRWLSVLDTPAGGIVMAGEAPSARPEPAYRVGVSCMRLGDRLRFHAALKDAATARILWAEHHDRRFGQDIFDVVDELAGSLARRLDREVELAEIARASRQPVEALSARDCVLRAIPLIFKLTPKSFAEAERLLLAGLEANPPGSLGPRLAGVLVRPEHRAGLGDKSGGGEGRARLSRPACDRTRPEKPACALRGRAHRGLRGARLRPGARSVRAGDAARSRLCLRLGL